MHICLGLNSTSVYLYIYNVYDRILDDFPAKNTVYTPYIYGSGQPYNIFDSADTSVSCYIS